jgi:hypothetical protein
MARDRQEQQGLQGQQGQQGQQRQQQRGKQGQHQRRRHQQREQSPGFAVRAPWTQQSRHDRDLDATRPDDGRPVDPAALRNLFNQIAFDSQRKATEKEEVPGGPTLRGKPPSWRKPRNIHKLYNAPVDPRTCLRKQHQTFRASAIPSDLRKVHVREKKLLDSEIEAVQGLAKVAQWGGSGSGSGSSGRKKCW